MVSNMKTAVLLVSILMCAGEGAQVGADDEPLSPNEIYEDIGLYDGNEIALLGHLSHPRCLYQSEARFLQFEQGVRGASPDFNVRQYQDDGITLLNAQLLVEHQELLVSRTIELQGIIQADYLDGTVIDLEACGRHALIVDETAARALIESLQ